MSELGKLRVLLIEDSDDDALLVLRELKRGGFDVIAKRVCNEQDLRTALGHEAHDLVITDHNMPAFSSTEALNVVREYGIDVPIIIVSGSIGEDIAVASMKSGAHDYIMKDQLARLVPAVERELREVLNRRAQRYAESALIESEARYRVLVEMAPEAIFVVDTDTKRIVDANSNAERLFGCSRNELLKYSLFDFYPSEQPDGLSVERSIHDHIERVLHGEHLIFERTIKNTDGRLISCETRLVSLPSKGRNLIRASMIDISDRKASQARIERLSKSYRALSEINQAIVRMEDETNLLPLVCRMAVDFGGMKMAWIGQLNEKKNLIEPSISYGSSQNYLDGIIISASPDVPEGRGPAATAYRESRDIIIKDFAHDNTTNPWHVRAAQYGFKSSGTFPLLRGKKPFAVLCVYHEQADVFDAEMIELFDEMAHDISFALDNFDREKEKQTALSGLSSSERHFRAYFERSLVGMAATSPEKGWIEVNDALCKMLGYTREELLRMNWAELTHPDDIAENLEQYNRMLSGEIDTYTIENRFIRKDGEAIYARRAPQAVRKANGSIEYVVALVEDITERRRAENNEHLRNHILELLTQGAPLKEILDVLVHGVEAENSAMLCSILLLDSEEKHLTMGAAPSLPEFYNTAISGFEIGPETGSCGTAAYTGKRVIVEDIRTHPYWKNYRQLAEQANLLSCWSEPIYGSTNKVLGTFAIYHRKPSVPSKTDIALIGSCARLVGLSIERKLIEEELQLASMVYNNSSEAMMVTNENNQIIAINPAFSEITGYSMDEVSGRDPKLLKSGRHNTDFYKSLWDGVKIRGLWHGEIWNRRKSGDTFPEWLTINTIFNQDGSPHRYVALFSDITDKVRTDELIWKQANFDLLTELPNRRMFHDRLEQEIKKAHRANALLALLFIDLDRFKEVNDTLGHQIGDLLLIEASQRIACCVRESDTVARLGGDEFTVILSELPDTDHAEKIAQQIIDKLAEPFLLGGETAYVSASIGITFYPGDALDVEHLLRNADQAMYVAKNAGRNRFSYFTNALQDKAQLRLRLLNDLRGALAANQFMLYFQPVVDLATGNIIKAEALIRWLHPERGMVSPMDFIPLAEESGLIIEIGGWVFREAARWTSRWVRMVPDGFQISVNKSPVQFQNADNSIDDWLSFLHTLGISGKHIVIEITEGLLLNADAGITDKLLKFRDAGIQVAIDDFGTGYSSLSYLKKLDIDYLKIDKSFVRDIATDPSDLALSEAIIMMAHKLGLKVIAEGVETLEQKSILVAAGCDYAQGYLFSRPVPPEEFERLIKADMCEGEAGR